MNSDVTTSPMTAADHAIHAQAQRKVYRDAEGRVIEKPVTWAFRKRQ